MYNSPKEIHKDEEFLIYEKYEDEEYENEY